MRTSSYRVESKAVRIVGPSRILAALRVAVVRAARTLIPERWVLDLLGLALAGVLMIAAALYACALASRWPMAAYPVIPEPRRSGHEVLLGPRHSSIDAWCHDAP